jgi:hypothetical protein
MSFEIKNDFFNDIFKCNKQAIDLAIEIVSCRGTTRRLESLRSDLRETNPKTQVHLCNELRAVGMSEAFLRRFFPAFAQRMQRTIAIFVQQRLSDELQSHFDPHRASTHGFARRFFLSKIQEACVECFARASALSSAANADSFGQIRTALVARLEELWMKECVPFVEDEKRAMHADALDVSKLIEFVQTVSKAQDDQSAALAWAEKYDSVKHISERVRENAWFDARMALWPLDRSAFVCGAWARERGEQCAAALSRDQQDLIRLSRLDSSSPEWIGLKLCESIATPQEGFMLLPPSHINGFNTSTRRLFVVPQFYDRSVGKQWNLLPIQLVWILREMLSQNWFQVGGVSSRYAEAIVAAECNELADKTLEILEALGEYVDVDPNDLEEALASADKEVSARLFPTGQTSSSSSSSNNSISHFPIPEFLWKPPQYTDTKLYFFPNRVCITLAVDYAVVHAVHSMIARAVQSSRLKGVAVPVSTTFSNLISTVSTLLRSRTCVNEVEINSLRQTVPYVVKKLIAFGERCCKENLVSNASTVEWNAQIVGKRNKELVIGRGSFDRTCDVCCEVCARVKSSMDENGPLPGKLEWTKRRNRTSTLSVEKKHR